MMEERSGPDTNTAEKSNKPLIEIGAVVAPKLNLAMQQNAVPFVRELFVANKSDETVENLVLRVEGDPAFCNPREWHIDRLAADSHFHITDVKVDLSTAFLEETTEAVLGSLTFTLTYATEVLTYRAEVQVLAKDEWGGINDLPEIIAAYVQPNDPIVEQILRDTSKRLQGAGKNPSLEGYQSNSPRRVAEIASAIWSTICHLDFTYAVPPASFERNGQKVRPPSRIFNTRLATCLDFTLLFASCLEQAGLNALTVFTRSHTFVGCWLQDIDFSHAVVDDIQTLRKRAQLKELLVWETTLVTHKPPTNFSFACRDAETKLQNDDEFELAIDIKRARMARIRPVSERVSSDILGEAGQDTAEPIEVPLDVPLDLPDVPTVVPDLVEEVSRPETPDARLEHWKRKLLDLSLRNRLLNFRATRRAVVIDIPDPAKLEDSLADGKKLRILPSPEMMEGHDPRSQALHWEQRQEDASREYALRALERGELLVRQTEDRLQASLIELYRASRAAIQEGGANILYLAFGFLTWRRDGRSERTPKAPLILIPVQLSRRSVRSAFQLTIHEDEPRFNPTLLEMLRQDHGIQMAELEGDLPTDDTGLDVERIWNMVRLQVRDIPGWEVVEDVVLSTFSFAKSRDKRTDWAQPQHSSTIQTAVVGNTLYLLGRAFMGVETYRFQEIGVNSRWDLIAPHGPFGNPIYEKPENYSTIQTAVIDNTLHLLGRGLNGGIEIWRFNEKGSPQWVSVGICTCFNHPGWDEPQYYSTIQSAVIDNTLHLLGRGPNGVELYRWEAKKCVWTHLETCVAFKDPDRSDPKYYRTIQTAVVGKTLYLLGRSPKGIELYSWDGKEWSHQDTCREFQDPDWAEPKYYETIQSAVIGDTLAVIGRGIDGIRVHTFREPTQVEDTVLQFFSQRVKLKRIGAAEAALQQYYIWDRDPYSYFPPKGCHYDRPLRTRTGDIFGKPKPPPAEAFAFYGAVAINSALADNNEQVAQFNSQMIVALGGLYLAGLGGGAAGALSSASSAVFATVFPHAAISLGLVESSSLPTAGLVIGPWAGAFAGAAAIVVVALTIAAIEFINVIEADNLPSKLRATIKREMDAPLPNITDMLSSDQGIQELRSVFLEAFFASKQYRK
jgi:hypothetical protein